MSSSDVALRGPVGLSEAPGDLRCVPGLRTAAAADEEDEGTAEREATRPLGGADTTTAADLPDPKRSFAVDCRRFSPGFVDTFFFFFQKHFFQASLENKIFTTRLHFLPNGAGDLGPLLLRELFKLFDRIGREHQKVLDGQDIILLKHGQCKRDLVLFQKSLERHEVFLACQLRKPKSAIVKEKEKNKARYGVTQGPSGSPRVTCRQSCIFFFFLNEGQEDEEKKNYKGRALPASVC